jgi:hypothetical protein
MTRYYFDVIDGLKPGNDSDGLELADDDDPRRLVDIVADSLPDGATREFSVSVRTSAGVQIFQAEIAFSSRWLAKD